MEEACHTDVALGRMWLGRLVVFHVLYGML